MIGINGILGGQKVTSWHNPELPLPLLQRTHVEPAPQELGSFIKQSGLVLQPLSARISQVARALHKKK